MIQDRNHRLSDKELKQGKYVLYWMQQAQRAQYNQALDFAVTQANAFDLPLVVLFVVTTEFPNANLRHYNFMLQGLSETFHTLKNRNIETIISKGKWVDTVVKAAQDAALLITDQGYLRIQRNCRRQIAAEVDCQMLEVESEVLFPVELIMQKEAYNAKVLRDKIHKFLQVSGNLLTQDFDLTESLLQKGSTDNFNIMSLLPRTDMSVSNSEHYQGGHSEAVKHLKYFVKNLLDVYYDQRNDPGKDCQSKLSPYLHFGQISVLEILAKVIKALDVSHREFWNLVVKYKPGTHSDPRVNSALVLFEEMIVRRELSMNFCHFNDDYDQYSVLPVWARSTLREHSSDPRPYIYGVDALEKAETHDVYWNAAQMEMVKTGKMHGYMRMYWGKKIIEWTPDPEDAFAIAQYLNDKYELDGRDPNGYAGIAWCFGKHDRAWQSNPIFGNVRIMKDSGLKRKFDMPGYLNRIESL
ncbi:MAG: deoxyribodipyrimidine photo-lyase [Candidatus Cloacimonadaceae bacterium]